MEWNGKGKRGGMEDNRERKENGRERRRGIRESKGEGEEGRGTITVWKIP